jgi:hypothetical protein
MRQVIEGRSQTSAHGCRASPDGLGADLLSVQFSVACFIACVANKHRLPANAQLHFNRVTGADFRDTHR